MFNLMSLRLDSLMTQKININSKAVNSVYNQIIENHEAIQIVMGGSSSGKSAGIALLQLMCCIRGENILVCRQTLVSITDSVWQDFLFFIDRFNLEHLFKITHSTKKIECINGNNGVILFKGLEHIERLKSVRGKRPINTIWIDEATETINESVITQLRLRMRGNTPFRKKIILSFNPINTTNWIYKTYFLPIIKSGEWDDKQYVSEDLRIIKTTYRDNLKFLDEDEIDVFKGLTGYHKKVYADGGWGTLGDRIYSKYKVESVPSMNLPVYVGGDLGYNDPTAVVCMMYDKFNMKLYIFDEIQETNLLPMQLATRMRAMFDRNKMNHRQRATFDSNEPRLIQQLNDERLNIFKSIKGAGSVLAGIMWLMQVEIIIDPRCKNTIEAMDNYEWKKNKAGETLSEPEHTFSHMCDAIRYGTETLWRGSPKTIGTRSNIY